MLGGGADTVEGFAEVLLRIGVGEAQVALAVLAERCSSQGGDGTLHSTAFYYKQLTD
jgi:hypothetical protein